MKSENLWNKAAKIYGMWFDVFGYQKDHMVQLHALKTALCKKGVLNDEDFLSAWMDLMTYDLEQIREHLQEEAKRKAKKSPFHFLIFARLKFFIIRVVGGARRKG